MFKTVQGIKIPDVAEYIKNYISQHSDDNIELIIGSDSQNYGKYTMYATVVVMYNTGHGGHVIVQKEKTEKERIRSVRLMNEVYRSISVAEELKKEGLPKPSYIDIDINPNIKYKSNEVFDSAVGLVKGMGYDCRYKTLGVQATYAADFAVRH